MNTTSSEKKVKETDALENTTPYECDSTGRLIKVTNLPEPGISYGGSNSPLRLQGTEIAISPRLVFNVFSL